MDEEEKGEEEMREGGREKGGTIKFESNLSDIFIKLVTTYLYCLGPHFAPL